MKILLLGPPGAGKGTQAELICEQLQIPKISTGDILRQAIADKTPVGLKVKSMMDAGHLVPDDLIVAIVKNRITEEDCQNGFLFDGFPRTIPQAQALQTANIKLDSVIAISVPDATLVKRLSGRRVHSDSGRTYHIEHSAPKVDGMDDETGEPLIQREDDKPETVQKRLSVYHDLTEPLIAFYQSLQHEGVRFHRIDGSQSVDVVKQAVFSVLSVKTAS